MVIKDEMIASISQERALSRTQGSKEPKCRIVGESDEERKKKLNSPMQ
jgi:hypothetical protein